MRLMGIHPMDAYLNDDLTSMLQACQTLDPTAGSLVSELWNDVVSANDLPVLENEYQRRIGQMPAMDRESAREHLIGVVRTEIEWLEEKAQSHQERDELKAELAPNLAKFDLSHEGLLMLRYEFAWRRLMDRKTKELEKLSEERSKSGRGRSSSYLLPSEGWLQTDDRDHLGDDHDHENDDHHHELDDWAGFHLDDEEAADVGTDAESPAVEDRRDEAAGMGVPAVLRNEPKDVSRVVEGATDDAGGSLRNEPTVVSEAVEAGRGEGEVEEAAVRNEGGIVRSVRFDEGLTGAMRDAGRTLRPEIRLRDAVRLGNRDGVGGSRRERRLRKKEAARARAK